MKNDTSFLISNILRLSDSFDESSRENADIEVKVRMINVNYGHNAELMESCRPLAEYSWFIKEIRKNRRNCDIEISMKRAIESMPQDYTLKNFLINHKAEVFGMLDTEYNEEEVWETFKQDYYRIGREEGKEEAYLDSVKSLMRTMNLSVEKAMDALCISVNGT